MLKIPPKTQPMCHFYNIYYISYNQPSFKCISAKFRDSTFIPKFFITIFRKNHVLRHFLPLLPQKCSTLGGLSQTLQMIFIINDSLSVLVWRFQLLLLCLRFLLSNPKKSWFFYSFLLKTPQKHIPWVNFIIFVISAIISNPWSVFVPSCEIPLSSLDFLLPYSQKITFYDIFCLKCPKNSL